MRVRVWKGFHSQEARELIRDAWGSEETLLILRPPGLGDAEERLPDFAKARFPAPPVLGLFTSGTSGERQKLVLYSKANIRASLNGILEALAPARVDSIFCYPQPFHTFGLLLGYVLSLEMGWPLFAGEGKYSSESHDHWLSSVRPGLLTLGTPTHFQDLLAHVAARGARVGPSASCIIGGAKVTASLWRRVRQELGIELPSIGYGATEASPGISHLPAGREPREDGEIGFPLKGVDVRLKPSGGFELRGANVCMAGVREGRIEFPKEVFIADEIACREDGVWVYRGRGDLVLNRGGEKFSLAEIEALLSRKLGVEALALSMPHERLGQELGLLVVAGRAAEAGACDDASILAALSERFSVRFDPALFLRVPKLPLNDNLKPDRAKALEKMLLQTRARPGYS